MSLFKQKIYYGQFILDIIKFQFDFLENSFSKLIVLADELNVLGEKDKEDYFDKAQELVVVDILFGCCRCFNENLSSENVGQVVSMIYGKYLTECKQASKTLAEDRVKRVLKLVCAMEDEMQKQDNQNRRLGYKHPYEIQDEVEKQKFYLCRAFSNYCVGNDVKIKNWEGKNFAAFKFAKSFILADVVKTMLKEFRIIF
ncbi:MAG: hypothetical protein PHR00_00965 [Patescibacteria group bacterium]|nr:hypothetical protein [Patescibacteria group bacterium]